MNQVDLPDDWYGWRLRGRHLVSPDGQRLTRERLVGLMWRDELELRRSGYASRRRAEADRRAAAGGPRLVRVVIVELADYRENGIAVA